MVLSDLGMLVEYVLNAGWLDILWPVSWGAGTSLKAPWWGNELWGCWHAETSGGKVTVWKHMCLVWQAIHMACEWWVSYEGLPAPAIKWLCGFFCPVPVCRFCLCKQKQCSCKWGHQDKIKGSSISKELKNKTKPTKQKCPLLLS